MNKEEQACKDMADVCELAHARTVLECESKGIEVDCDDQSKCGFDDEDHDHDDIDAMHYTRKAQAIFDRHYDDIIEKTGL